MGRSDDAVFHLGLAHPSHLESNDEASEYFKNNISNLDFEDVNSEICFDTGVHDFDLVSVAEVPPSIRLHALFREGPHLALFAPFTTLIVCV